MKRSGDMPKKYPHFKTSTVDKKWDKILMLRHHCFEYEKKVFAESASRFEKVCFIFPCNIIIIILVCTFACKVWKSWFSELFLRISKDEQDYAEKFNLPPATTSRRTVQAVKLNLAKALIRFDMEAYFPNEYEPFQSTCKSHFQTIGKKVLWIFSQRNFPFLEYYLIQNKKAIPFLKNGYWLRT